MLSLGPACRWVVWSLERWSAAAGLEVALWTIGACYFVTTLAPFVFPAWRGMDRRTVRPIAGGSQPPTSATNCALEVEDRNEVCTRGLRAATRSALES